MEESFAVVEGGEKICDNGKEDENLGDHIGILEEMESLLGDIDERLMISRMVSDSLIKGMVNAVEEQAAERIARKELEVVGLKKMLDGFRVASDETKTLWFSVNHCEPHEAAKDQFSDNVVECDRCIMSVDSLQLAINEQLNQLKKEINKIRGPSSIRRISSGSDLVGLSGILQENTPEKWIYVDKAFESLKDTVDAFRRRMEVKDQLSKTLLSEWQQEQEFRSEIEWMVISNGIWGLQQEFEQKLWGRYDSESRNCFNQYKEISSLRQELDSIFKMLSVAETGHLISHGSLENTEEWCHNKRADHFHVKLSTDHSPSTTEENGKQEESKINKPENLDSASLKHMSKEELVTYITKMRRNHESQERDMTEENFRLRRELLNLKERGSSFPLKKDKEFELLKKKIPGVISKLNKILDGNEKIHQFSENIESLSNLKGILDFLHFENHQLKDMLADKKKESTNLSSQLSAAEKKLSQQQITEKNLLQTIQKLEDDDIGDAHTQVSVIQDIYKCFFEDIVSEFRCITEELHLKNSFMQEIYEVIIKEASHSAEASSGLGIEEADMESTMMQGLLDINHIIFKETLVNADEALKLEAAENRKLKYEMLMLKLVVDPTKGNLVAALEEIKQYKEQMHQLHQNLEQRNNKLRETDEERRVLCALIQKQQEALKLIEAKERENRKQMESTINLIHKLLTMVTDFEARVNKDISRNCLRLQNMRSEFHWINNKANVLKTMGLVYKQRLETRSSDLAKAEAEVDLLGDEVDTLLSLLEKIYIALDHYSPILQHYPGIIEILELVRRELSGESRKLV